MKTIEQKARAYDEAIERARVYWKTDNDNTLDIKARGTMEHLFPELKESENEKIRKEIMSYIKSSGAITNKQWIAWLEKQHTDPYNGVCFDCYGHHWGMCARDNGIEIAMDGTPVRQFSYKDCEQTFGGKTALEAIKEERVDNANKVEQRFKVGDWIATTYGKVNQVVSVDKDGDGYTLDDGVYFSGSWCDMYHLWAIEDAKDGDVLCVKYGNDEMPFIFTGKQDDVAYCALNSFGEFVLSIAGWLLKTSVLPATKEQCDLLFQKMKEAGYEWDAEKKELKKISQEYPLTPDECTKSAWNKEDERIYYSLLADIRTRQDGSTNTLEAYYNEQIDWLKSIKEKLKGE